jgi:hypothetical protein
MSLNFRCDTPRRRIPSSDEPFITGEFYPSFEDIFDVVISSLKNESFDNENGSETYRRPYVCKYHFGFESSCLLDEFMKNFSLESKPIVFYEVFFDTYSRMLMKRNIWIKKVVDQDFQIIKYVVRSPIRDKQMLLYVDHVCDSLDQSLAHVRSLDEHFSLDVPDISLRIQIRTERKNLISSKSTCLKIYVDSCTFLSAEKPGEYLLFCAKGSKEELERFAESSKSTLMKSKILEYLNQNENRTLGRLEYIPEHIKKSKQCEFGNLKCLFKVSLKNVFVPISDDERPKWMLERKNEKLNVSNVLKELNEDLTKRDFEKISICKEDIVEFENEIQQLQ